MLAALAHSAAEALFIVLGFRALLQTKMPP
jgi:hypothetical protein